MRRPADVRRIHDRTERLAAATELLAEVEAKRDQARSLRDMAMIVAHLDQGVQPVHIYRDTVGVSRGLFNRVIQRAPDKRPVIPNAVEVAGAAQADLKKWVALVDEVMDIRDDLALSMMNGVADDGGRTTPVSNANVARITGLTTARVAQMRTGS